MARRPTQSRVVRFFELLEHDTGLPLSDDLPWDSALLALQTGVSVADRTVNFEGSDHHGGPWLMSGFTSMLLFSRIRDNFDLPELFDRQRGTLDVLQVAESKGVAETTHIGFFPNNVIAMVRSGTDPGAGSFQKWINKMDIFDDLPLLDVAPLSRVAVTEKFKDVDQARGIKVRMRTTAAQSISSAAPYLSSAVDTLQETFGPVMVEMRIYLPKDEGYTEEARMIEEEARGLMALTSEGHAVDGLEAATIMYRSLETEKGAEINMLKDKLAERVEVEVIDTDGRATRRESASRAMLQAYTALKGDLEKAVQRSRN